jgi:hypothetical protein
MERTLRMSPIISEPNALIVTDDACTEVSWTPLDAPA